jgi:hypothetical protein
MATKRRTLLLVVHPSQDFLTSSRSAVAFAALRRCRELPVGVQ